MIKVTLLTNLVTLEWLWKKLTSESHFFKLKRFLHSRRALKQILMNFYNIQRQANISVWAHHDCAVWFRVCGAWIVDRTLWYWNTGGWFLLQGWWCRDCGTWTVTLRLRRKDYTSLQKNSIELIFIIQLDFLLLNTIMKAIFPITFRFSKKLWQRCKI